MSKDFYAQIVDQSFKQDLKLDPYVYVTQEVNQIIKSNYIEIATKFILSYLASNVLVAPFQTIVTSLQLSVIKHKNIYQKQQARTKQLAKLNTQMTIHQKRRFQLMIRAGGKTAPYTAPVYEGYKQAFQGLKSQGWKGFYKGLFFRTILNGLCLLPFATTSIFISTQEIQKGVVAGYMQLFLTCLSLDLVLNPLHMMQNRYILQNRIQQFKVIKKPLRALRNMSEKGQAYKGLSFHLINNTIGFFTRFPMYFSIIGGVGPQPMLFGLYSIGELLTYPFSTGFKRIQCQSQRYAGLIPVRYSGLFHSLRVIYYQQGIKGLWRGFPLHLTQNIFRFGFLHFIGLGRNNLNIF